MIHSPQNGLSKDEFSIQLNSLYVCPILTQVCFIIKITSEKQEGKRMKLLHVGDLHIGKKIKGFSLADDIQNILNRILQTAKDRNVDGILIAGDIYDSTNPSSEALSCFDDFISKLHDIKVSCFAVSGNHDNIYRVSFGSQIMSRENIYFAKKYSGTLEPIEVSQDVNIWLLPFIRPIDVRTFYPDFANGSYEEMMKTVLKNISIDKKKTNILVAHQFVTCNGKAPEKSDSESVSLGTLDNIDVSNFEDFDYVALGHIHKPQAMGRQTVRYSGSPLKYSFSEQNDKKSMVLLDIKGKQVDIEFIDFCPLRDMREVVGYYDDLKKYAPTDDYVKIILKDENFIIDIKHKLESNFSRIMEIVYDNTYTRENRFTEKAKAVESQSPLELFKDFYELQNNQEMTEKQLKKVEEIFASMGEKE